MDNKQNKIVNIVLTIILIIALVFAAYSIFFTFAYFASEVEGQSMVPTYNSQSGEQDRVLCSRIAHYTYGDIVIIRVPEGEDEGTKEIIKRVYAFGGDSVDMRFEDHYLKVIVNGNVVEESWYGEPVYYETIPKVFFLFCALKDAWQGEGGGSDAIIIPQDTVFVLGDNREGSMDSATYGPYKTSSVIAKVLTKIDKGSFAPWELIKFYL